MPLLAFNLTGSPVTLAAGNPAPTLPASAAPPARSTPPYNVTSELWPNLTVDPARGKTGGLTAANFTALQAQVTGGSVAFEWTSDPEYDTGSLYVSGPTPGVHALVGSDHTATGLTVGQVPRATGAATFAWAKLQPGDLEGEERVDAPELDMLDVAGGAAIAAAGGDIILVGRELLQGQTFDGITLTEGAASVGLYALKPGISGITVVVTVGIGGATLITFNPGTGILGIELPAAGDSDDNVATAINANASACNGYVRAVSATGGNFTLAQSSAPMTGGTGDYAKNKVMVAGLEALPANETGISATAKWSDTEITCTTQAVGAATDIAAVAVQSNGRWTQQICGVMI